MDIEKQMATDFEEFSGYVQNVTDPVSAFLRVHLVIEQSLENIIRIHLCSPANLLNDGRLTFNQKLLLVGSFNILDKKVFNSIRKLNDIRNKLAHDLEFDLDKDTIELLGNELRPWFTNIKKQYPDDHLQWLGRVLPYLAGKIASYTVRTEKNT